MNHPADVAFENKRGSEPDRINEPTRRDIWFADKVSFRAGWDARNALVEESQKALAWVAENAPRWYSTGMTRIDVEKCTALVTTLGRLGVGSIHGSLASKPPSEAPDVPGAPRRRL